MLAATMIIICYVSQSYLYRHTSASSRYDLFQCPMYAMCTGHMTGKLNMIPPSNIVALTYEVLRGVSYHSNALPQCYRRFCIKNTDYHSMSQFVSPPLLDISGYDLASCIEYIMNLRRFLNTGSHNYLQESGYIAVKHSQYLTSSKALDTVIFNNTHPPRENTMQGYVFCDHRYMNLNTHICLIYLRYTTHREYAARIGYELDALLPWQPLWTHNGATAGMRIQRQVCDTNKPDYGSTNRPTMDACSSDDMRQSMIDPSVTGESTSGTGNHVNSETDDATLELSLVYKYWQHPRARSNEYQYLIVANPSPILLEIVQFIVYSVNIETLYVTIYFVLMTHIGKTWLNVIITIVICEVLCALTSDHECLLCTINESSLSNGITHSLWKGCSVLNIRPRIPMPIAILTIDNVYQPRDNVVCLLSMFFTSLFFIWLIARWNIGRCHHRATSKRRARVNGAHIYRSRLCFWGTSTMRISSTNETKGTLIAKRDIYVCAGYYWPCRYEAIWTSQLTPSIRDLLFVMIRYIVFACLDLIIKNPGC